MNKKKLLIVAHHLTIGGVQKSLISALKVLDYDKFDVTLYLRKNRTDLLPMIDERVNVIINDDKHHYYRRPRAILLQSQIALLKAMAKREKANKVNEKLSQFIVKSSMDYEKKRFFSKEKYDIAIAYVQGYVTLFTAECVNADEKYVFYHTSVDELHNIHERVIHKFHKVVAIHDQQAELIKKWYPQIADRITIVENFCDKELLEEQSKAFAVDKPQDKTVLCSCGRFSQVKGFDLAVETARILQEKNIPFLWYFVGDGPEREKIEKLITEYGLQKDIVITGMQKNPYPYMSACDLYVQPSYQEAMPLTLIEAKRLNKPMVTTATVGGKKLVNDGVDGFVCGITAVSLASDIEKLITDTQEFNIIKNNLSNTDYREEKSRYKAQWQKLLEE